MVARHRLLHENRFLAPGDRRWYSTDCIPILYRNYARQISRQLGRIGDVDMVCSGVGPSVQPVSYLDCKQPIVIWADTTIASAIDFYPQFYRNRICPESIANIVANEQAALDRCRLAIFSSEWDARNAIDFYHVDPSRVKVVPYGANAECNRTLDDIRTLVDARPQDQCRLLFVGVDWMRKGGDLAVEVATALNRAGLPTELTVVGCDPPLGESFPGFVRFLGYINNSTSEGKRRLNSLFAESHFFIMPSRAESYGHVFCEASSFGVPSLATDVGGITTAVRNDRNGRAFALDAGAKEYCDYVLGLFASPDRYKDLDLSSFHEYETRLNWGVAGKAVRELLRELI